MTTLQATHNRTFCRTLVEWDTNLPALAVLLDEARHAEELADVQRYVDAA